MPVASRSSRRRPEVLAPVGSPDCLPAAVAGGADAVYLGLRHFNARGRAENFRMADLPQQVGYLHANQVRCYVVLNTLLHDDELPKAIDMAWQASEAGVDAAIIQDLGLWQALAEHVPQLERHASTQMTVHDPEQLALLAELGARRVILAREMNRAEVRRCTERGAALGVETEHFVHGALCYAYSGQCLISNFAGCRSANRGTCAQNCRFDYDDAVGQRDTPFSMKDLSLLSVIPQLADDGVASLKIEGRLKGPDYVYTVSRVYREATEAWARGKAFDKRAADLALQDVFSRGFTAGSWADDFGPNNRLRRYRPEQDRRADATLVRLDRKRGRAVIRAAEAPEPGQGYACSVGFSNVGFLVTAVDSGKGRGEWSCAIRIDAHGPHLPSGLELFKNINHRRRKEARQAMAAIPWQEGPVAGVPVSVTVIARADDPLRLQARLPDGSCVEAKTEQSVEHARGGGLSAQAAAKAIGSLGGTGLSLAGVQYDIADGVYIPQAAIRRARQDLVDAVKEQRLSVKSVYQRPAEHELVTVQTDIIAAVDSLEQMSAALEAGADGVWLQGHGISPADMAAVPEQVCLRHAAVLALDKDLIACGRPVVSGQLGAIAAARAAGVPVIADHHLNVFSQQSLASLAGLGCSGAVISLECSCREVARLLRRRVADQIKIYMTVHGRLPAMITRQDHQLGEAIRLQASPEDGGLAYDLQPRQGYSVLWEGRRLAAPEPVAKTAGLVDAWVLELGDLSPTAVQACVQAYRGLQRGELSADAVLAELSDYQGAGWFPGHLEQGSRMLDAK